ncbi:MAG: SDR family oxidoreductase [Candidatus Omnitrophica bacterium]|nr:SDR family oxidoreductase [Candidatus Omnitrophota bacterium]
MSRFLVTGGAGFIGSHIVEELVAKRHFVRILDNFSSGKTENLKNVFDKIELFRGDIRSSSDCNKACAGIDFVLHQAALRSVPKSMKNPAEYNDVNIAGTLNMLQAALSAKVKRFVFASSSSVYGDVDKFPEKEDFLPQLISPYALSKLAGEYYCRIFSQNYGLETACLRYFNVFGQRQALDDEYAVVIPKFISCMLNNENPPIYGTGKQSRDFTYVKNVVNANLLAAKKPGLKGEVFNVASGKDYSVLELVKFLNQILKKDIKPAFLKPRQGDVFRTSASLLKIKKVLGFCPKVNFVEGLKLTVEYFKNK